MSIRSAAKGASTTLFSNLFVSLPVPETDFSKQTIIVTGSNTGLGYESSLHLLRLGVEKLIMGVRSLEKGEAARQKMLEATGRTPDTIEVWRVDMESYESVKQFAARAAGLPLLHAVLANAGIMTTNFSKVEDNERTITVNVVSTFLLCLLLLPKLRETASATGITPRITIPNSALHYLAPLKELNPATDMFAVLNDPQKADMASRYPVSKLLVIYIIRELADRLKKSNKGPVVVFNTPNPSFCDSGLIRENDTAAAKLFTKVLARSTEMGSRALVDGLGKGEESNGQYLTNCHLQTPSSLVTSAKGQEIQKKLFTELMQKLEAISPGISSTI